MNDGGPLRLRCCTCKSTIWEGGHYYEAKGPTQWSHESWKILTKYAASQDARLLFVDDVHALEDVHTFERELESFAFNPVPAPTHIVTESSVHGKALEALEQLKRLPKRQRARKGRSGAWYCSGFQLTKAGGDSPLCLLYDMGLTFLKRELGFTHAVNILPSFYEAEQRRLKKLVSRILPEFHLDVVLHDLEGSWRLLDMSAPLENTAGIALNR